MRTLLTALEEAFLDGPREIVLPNLLESDLGAETSARDSGVANPVRRCRGGLAHAPESETGCSVRRFRPTITLAVPAASYIATTGAS